MSSETDYLDVSRWLLWVSFALDLVVLVAALAGRAAADRRFLRTARAALIANAVVLAAVCAGLLAGFVVGAYEVKYIHSYSERALPISLKLVGLWAGLDGSILFWAFLLAVVGAVVAIGTRESEPGAGRRLEPWIYVALAVQQLFFAGVIAIEADPFRTYAELNEFPHGGIADGQGLNPQLHNYWMQIHPPCLYFGWVLYSVPFAYALAALFTGELGTYWIRKVRRWMLLGWLFNTSGCIMGGLWAYETLGWGGFWAWDPVENASALPWFTATAFLHSIMVQERRDMLRLWNVFLICATFLLSIFGTWLTRSGAVASVHAFASGNVGGWFLSYLVILLVVTLFFLALRSRDLRSPNRFESLCSREAVFILNNMILLAFPVVMGVLTLWPKISYEFLRTQFSIMAVTYGYVTAPLFIILLFLTALGPGMAWVSTSKTVLLRNFRWPAIVAFPLAALVQYTETWVHGGEGGAIPLATQLYPVAPLNYCACLILTSLAFDVGRAATLRARGLGRSWIVAACGLMMKDNRRYGGYIVHTGVAVLALSAVGSSYFEVKADDIPLMAGDKYALGRYELDIKNAMSEPRHPVFARLRVFVDVKRNQSVVASLVPELRSYPTTEIKPGSQLSAPKVHRTLLEDVYIFFQGSEKEGVYTFTFFRKPFMIGIWFGWMLMLAGGVWAALPMGGRRRVGLAE